MSDLSELRSGTRVVAIKHPKTGAPTGVEWELRALDSTEAQAAKRRITDRRNKLSMKGKTFTAEEIEANAVELLASCSVGWTWRDDADWKGKKPDFNAVNVRAVLEGAPFIRLQLSEALDETEAFF